MAQIVKRIIAVLAVLVGVGAVGGGVWLASQIGPKGSATFSARPSASAGAVIVTPMILNRLDADFVVTARAATPGDTVFLGVSAPSDADLIVGAMPVTRMTGLSVRDQWAIRSTTQGSGEVHAISGADIWRSAQQGTGVQTVTIGQSGAPESLVIAADKGRVGTVTITVERKAWFVQSVITAVVGLAVAFGGVLLWRSRFGESTTPPRVAIPAGPSAADPRSGEGGHGAGPVARRAQRARASSARAWHRVGHPRASRTSGADAPATPSRPPVPRPDPDETAPTDPEATR